MTRKSATTTRQQTEAAVPPTEALDGQFVLAERLGYLLGQAHLTHRRLAEAELADLDLLGKEFGALAVLVAHGDLSQQRLGQLLGIDRTTMVALVDNLERKQLAKRHAQPADRRAYAVRATPHGREVLTRAEGAIQRAESLFLSALPAQQRHAFTAALARLVHEHRATTDVS